MNARDYALHLLAAKPLPGLKDLSRSQAARALPSARDPGRSHEGAVPSDPRDRALGEAIAVGVVKNLLRLHRLIEHFSGRRLAQIDPAVAAVAAIGLYQLRYLDRIPPSAAVDQAVEQIKRLGQPHAAGFVNAVLRKATRQADPAPPDPRAYPLAYAEAELSHPKVLCERFLSLLRSICESIAPRQAAPDEAAPDEAAYGADPSRADPPCADPPRADPRYADAHALRSPATDPSNSTAQGPDAPGPAALGAEKFDETERLFAWCRHNNSEPPTIVRLFAGARIEQLTGEYLTREPLTGDAPALEKPAGPGFSALGVAPHEMPGMVVVTGAGRRDFAGFADAGLAQVQDPTAAGVIDRMQLGPGMRVLDRCCGVGTKTLQLAAAVGPTGSVVAVDPAGHRLEVLDASLRNLKLTNVRTVRRRWIESPLKHVASDTPSDARPPETRDAVAVAKTAGRDAAERSDANSAATPAFVSSFDRVLLDVPCSNSGVLRRRPEARYAQDDRCIAAVCALQRQILADTAGAVAPGGLLVYSTCSIWPKENRKQINRFLKRYADFELQNDYLTLPSAGDDPAQYHDGGYVAVLRRRT